MGRKGSAGIWPAKSRIYKVAAAESCSCKALSMSALGSGAPKGKKLMKRPEQMKRPELLNLVLKAGLDLPALCKKQGEIVALPSRPFLQSIVDKYGLAGVPEPKLTGTIAQYITQKEVCMVQETQESTGTAEDQEEEEQQQEAAEDEMDEEPLLNQNRAETSNKDWENQLIALGYGQLKIQPPNKAVQAVLCCFGEVNIHDFILEKEKALSDSMLSAVAHLGFNGWLAILARYMQSPEGVLGDIVGQYASMYEVLCSRTEREDFINAMGENVIEYMEDTNHISEKNRRKKKDQAPTPTIGKTNMGNSIFGAARAGIGPCNRRNPPTVANRDGTNTKEPERLNMFNSFYFPALTNDLVESLGKQFDHILWKCKNYCVLAPISAQSFAYMADLKSDQIESIKAVTESGECILERVLVELTFTTEIFEKTCTCPWGIYVNQKNHMAFQNLKRDDQFAMKLWRCFCPYIKCGCDKKYYRGDSRLKCRDNITWFDQAIWFLLNHLEVLYPGKPKNVALLNLIGLLSTVLQPTALAYIGFLHFRETLVKIAIDYAHDRNADIFRKYGNMKMIKIALDMIKPDPNEGGSSDNRGSTNTISSYGFSVDTDPASVTAFYPPRMIRNSTSADNGSVEHSTGSVLPTCNIAESSVNKGAGHSFKEHNIEPVNLNME